MSTVAVDPVSPVPPSVQLRDQLADAITTGHLPPRTPLPTVRQLAADLQLAPNTVAKAYRDLEQTGLVVTAGRRGTVVADVPPLPAAERRTRLERAAAAYLAEAARLGFTPADAARTLTSAAARRPA